MSMISPSMMCAPIDRLKKVLRALEEARAEYLHIDVMDGHFVPNFALGTDYVRQLRRMTAIPLDVHLMVTRPEDKIAWFDFQPGELVSIHAESTADFRGALQKVRDCGALAFAAISPPTPCDALRDVLDMTDGVLVMTVNPGFAGQKAVPEAIRKIGDVREMLARHGRGSLPIEVDGNVSFDRAAEMKALGADIFVCGTSSVFTRSMNMADAVARFRGIVG